MDSWENGIAVIGLAILIFFAGYFLGIMSKKASRSEDNSEKILAEIKEIKKMMKGS